MTHDIPLPRDIVLDHAILSAAGAINDLGWLACDLAGGEHECGEAGICRAFDAFDEAIAQLVEACARKLGKSTRDLDELRGLMLLRRRENWISDEVVDLRGLKMEAA